MTKDKTILNLSIRTTMQVTTDDLELYADPPLTFEAIGRINDTLHRELAAWATAGYPADTTARFIPRLFLSVAQNGQSYPLATQDDAQALREAVGDEFLANLVESFWDYEFNYFKKKAARLRELIASVKHWQRERTHNVAGKVVTIKPSPAMSQQLSHSLAQEFPEYFELNSILGLAAKVWPRFGISAADLIDLDPWTVELLRVSLDS